MAYFPGANPEIYSQFRSAFRPVGAIGRAPVLLPHNQPLALQRLNTFVANNGVPNLVPNSIKNFTWLQNNCSTRLTLRNRAPHHPDQVGIAYDVPVKYPYLYINPYLWTFHHQPQTVDYGEDDDIYLNHNFCFIRNGIMRFMDVDLVSMSFRHRHQMNRVANGVTPLPVDEDSIIDPFDAHALGDELVNSWNNGMVIDDLDALLQGLGIWVQRLVPHPEGIFATLFAIVYAYLHNRRDITLPDHTTQTLSYRLSLRVTMQGEPRNFHAFLNHFEMAQDRVTFPNSDQRHSFQASKLVVTAFNKAVELCVELALRYQNQGGCDLIFETLRMTSTVGSSVNQPLRPFNPPGPGQPGFNFMPNLAMDFGGCLREFMNTKNYVLVMNNLSTCDTLEFDMTNANENCGIREMYCFSNNIRKHQVRSMQNILIDEGNALRERAHREFRNTDQAVPLYGPLHHSHLATIAGYMGIKSLHITLLPHKERLYAEEYLYQSEEGHETCYLALFANHWFTMKQPEKKLKGMLEWRKCASCKLMFKTAAHTCQTKKKVGREGMQIDTVREDLRGTLYATKVTDTAQDIDHVLFMDFETHRVENDMHHVYAFGCAKGMEEPISYFHPTNCLRECVSYLQDIVGEHKQHFADLQAPAPDLYLFFYNGSRFDALLLIEAFVQAKILPTNLIMKNNQVMSATFMGILHLRDLCLFTACSLKKACKDFGIAEDKSKDEFDHHSIRKAEDWQAKRKELRKYLDLDIISMREIYIKMADDFMTHAQVRLTGRMTLSHAAFDALKITWYQVLTDAHFIGAIKLPLNAVEDGRWRKAYYGGRVFPQVRSFAIEFIREMIAMAIRDGKLKELYELLKKLGKGYKDLDIVSLYPSAMRGSDALSLDGYRHLPFFFCGIPEDHNFFGGEVTEKGYSCRDFLVRFQQYIEDMPDHALHDARLNPAKCIAVFDELGCTGCPFRISKQGAIVYLDLTPPKDLLTPLVPYKDKQNKNAVIWTLDEHKNTALSIDELLYAIIYGYRWTEIYSLTIFSARIDLFKVYVDKFFELKKNAADGSSARAIAKLFLNAAYGKLIQQIITEDIEIVDQAHLEHLMAEEINRITDEEDKEKTNLLKDVQPIVEHQTKESRRVPPEDVYHMQYEEIEERVQQMSEEFNMRRIRAWVVWKEKPPVSSKPVYLGLQTTAFSRMIMNTALYALDVLYKPENAMHYTDTDSLLIREELVEQAREKHPHMIGKEIGQLDDELKGGIVVEAYYISPKFYCLLFIMPDGSIWEKIRTKGMPHPQYKHHLGGYWPYNPEGQPEADEELVKSRLDLPLGTYIYEIRYSDESVKFFERLDIDIFKGMVDGSVVSLGVYFNTMQRKFFNDSVGTKVSGIQHICMHRTIDSMSWWLSADCPRIFLEPDHEVSVPRDYCIDA